MQWPATTVAGQIQQQQQQPGHARFSQDISATTYTRFNVFQRRLATSYREKVTETRNCRDLAVAGLHPGQHDR
jgi:hypothetical protein